VHDMEGTLEVLSQFHELPREQLRKLCGNDRAFSEAVKMVAAADMTNFSATINAGELVLSAICHASQEQRRWYKATIVCRQVGLDGDLPLLEVVTSRCACKLGES